MLQARPASAQRIPGAEADGLHFRHGEQAACERLGRIIGYGNLESVFAGIARARDEAARALDHPEGGVHEFQLAAIRYETGKGIHRRGPLQSEQGTLVEILDLDIAGDVGAQMRLVVFLAGGIHHQHQMIAKVGHHEVVEDAAGLVGEKGVARLRLAQPRNIGCHHALERAGGIAARFCAQAQLSHMRNIEQPGLGSGVQMFGQDSGRILHGHVVPGELHHLGAKLHMECVKRRMSQGFFSHRTLRQGTSLRQEFSLTAFTRSAPSVVEPERLTRTGVAGPSFPLR